MSTLQDALNAAVAAEDEARAALMSSKAEWDAACAQIGITSRATRIKADNDPDPKRFPNAPANRMNAEIAALESKMAANTYAVTDLPALASALLAAKSSFSSAYEATVAVRAAINAGAST